MAFLDELRKIGQAIDPSLGVQSNEVTQVLSALVHTHDHKPEDLVKAAEDGAEAVTNVLAPQAEAEEEKVVTDANDDVDELHRRISDLQAQLASRDATAKQTQVEHNGEPVVKVTE